MSAQRIKRKAKASKKKRKYLKGSTRIKLRTRKGRRSKAKAIAFMRRVALAFGLFFISTIFLGSLSLYRIINTHFASALSPSSYDLYSQDFFTVMYCSVDSFSDTPITVSNIHFMIFDKESSSLVVFDMPDDLLIDVPGKFGQEKVSKVFALGMLSSGNSLDGGISLMQHSIKQTVGLNVDRYIFVDQSLKAPFEDLLFLGNAKSLISIQSIKDARYSLKTNLSFGEIYEVYKLVGSVPEANLTTYQLQQGDLESTQSVDNLVKNITYDSKIATEKKSVSVLNGTNVAGAATFGSRVIENAGGRVIATSNAEDKYETSVLIVDDLTSETTQYISRFFDLDQVILKSDAGEFRESVMDRADVILIVGIDIAEVL